VSKHSELVAAWRAVGPVAWAEGPHGWIGDNGRPITLTGWQRAVLSAWWAHREDVTTLAISNCKKTGKTFTNSCLLAFRWLALPGEHFAAANDEKQAVGRQFSEVAAMVRRNPYLRANVEAGKKLLKFIPTGSTLEALPVDSSGNAGANHLTVSYTEAWGIIFEEAVRAYEELTPPPGDLYGFPPMRICDSYAGYILESETWHKLVDRGLAGESVGDEWPITLAGGLMLFHVEGDEGQRRCYRGTSKQAARYYADQQQALRPMMYQRLHLNQRTVGAEEFISGEQWDAITDPALTPLAPTKAEYVYVGLDIGLRNDTSAAVGVSANGDPRAGGDRARLAFHRIWKPSGGPREGGDVNLGEIADYLRWIDANYLLGGVFYDPSQAQFLAQMLREEGLRMVEVPQTLTELGPRGLGLWDAIRYRRLTVYPSDELRASALAAVADECPQGLHIRKRTAGRKVDPIVALSFALPAVGIDPFQVFFPSTAPAPENGSENAPSLAAQLRIARAKAFAREMARED